MNALIKQLETARSSVVLSSAIRKNLGDAIKKLRFFQAAAEAAPKTRHLKGRPSQIPQSAKGAVMLRFPDGSMPTEWIYASAKTAMSVAPGQLYGDTSLWSRAIKDGYSLVLVDIVPRAKAPKNAALSDKKKVKQLLVPSRALRKKS